MTLQEILEHRRAVRLFDSSKPLDVESVRHCIELATLAPTSSNMQLWECYHITDKNMLHKLATACLGQRSATSAQQMVVFVTRQDRYKDHAHKVLEANIDNIRHNSPTERQPHRIKLMQQYYGKLMPFQYSRFIGLWGLVRKALIQCVGLFRPIPRQMSEGDARIVVHKSCALVVQTFMLAMSEVGYDTCPLEGFDSYLVKKALHLPHTGEINMIIACGIRKPEGVQGDRFRLPFDEMYRRIGD